MKNSKKAFTMIELVFVIVILGILAAVAVPKFAASRVDAQISKARSDIASIRSAIVTERQSRLIKGDNSFINKLHHSTDVFFDANGTGSGDSELLMYGIKTQNADGHWYGTGTSGSNITYNFLLQGKTNTFTYNPSKGTFDCTQGTSAPNCNDLTK